MIPFSYHFSTILVPYLPLRGAKLGATKVPHGTLLVRCGSTALSRAHKIGPCLAPKWYKKMIPLRHHNTNFGGRRGGCGAKIRALHEKVAGLKFGGCLRGVCEGVASLNFADSGEGFVGIKNLAALSCGAKLVVGLCFDGSVQHIRGLWSQAVLAHRVGSPLSSIAIEWHLATRESVGCPSSGKFSKAGPTPTPSPISCV